MTKDQKDQKILEQWSPNQKWNWRTVYYYKDDFYYHLEFAYLSLYICTDPGLEGFINTFKEKFDLLVKLFETRYKEQDDFEEQVRSLNFYKISLDVYKRNNIDETDGKYKYKWMYCIDIYEDLLEYLLETK